jgi:hypothetical protein
MDRQLRNEIRADVREAVTAYLTGIGERWVTAEELCDQFQMFTLRWLKTYGEHLPRKRVTVTGPDGRHTTRWAYPQHEIAANIRAGHYDDMNVLFHK